MRSIIKKTFQGMVKKHENSQTFNVLKTISRLSGLITCGIFTLMPSLAGFNVLALIVTVILIDALFLFSNLKESSYKSSTFFDDNKITANSLDRYTMILTLLRLFLFVPMAMAGPTAFFLFMGLYFPGPWIVASFTGYKPYMPKAGKTPTNTWHQGMPGYDLSGNATSSPTAVGGLSN